MHEFARCQSLINCNNVFLNVGSDLELVDGRTWVGGVILMDQAIGDDENYYESPFNSSNTDSAYYEPD